MLISGRYWNSPIILSQITKDMDSNSTIMLCHWFSAENEKNFQLNNPTNLCHRPQNEQEALVRTRNTTRMFPRHLLKQQSLLLMLHRNQNTLASLPKETAIRKFEVWMKMYEDFVGLTVVKQAQHKVIEVSLNLGNIPPSQCQTPIHWLNWLLTWTWWLFIITFSNFNP